MKRARFTLGLSSSSVVARTEEELSPNVNRALFIRAHVNRRIPIEVELLLAVFGKRLDGASFVGEAIHSANFAALRFGIDVSGIGGIGKHPETVAAKHVFPTGVAHAARIRGISHPGTVVLQAAVNMIRIIIVHADVVEL